MRGSKLARRLGTALVVALVLAAIPQATLAAPTRLSGGAEGPVALDRWVGAAWIELLGWFRLEFRGTPMAPIRSKEGPGVVPDGAPTALGPCGEGACTKEGPEVGPDGAPSALGPCGEAGCTDEGPEWTPDG